MITRGKKSALMEETERDVTRSDDDDSVDTTESLPDEEVDLRRKHFKRHLIRPSRLPRWLFRDLVLVVATVLIWRGIWDLADALEVDWIPEHKYFGAIACTVIGLVILWFGLGVLKLRSSFM